jgi:hypothetical protein
MRPLQLDPRTLPLVFRRQRISTPPQLSTVTHSLQNISILKVDQVIKLDYFSIPAVLVERTRDSHPPQPLYL